MHPYPFTYHRATSVDDALNLLQEYPDDGKLLAGGHSLLPAMKLRLAQPGHLIDISRLTDLRGITRDGNTITIGALTTHVQIEESDVLRDACPILPAAAHVIGDQQVRNRGTIGGVLAHADPAADYPAVVLALDATIVATSPAGEREIPIGDFFQGFLTTALRTDELLTAIRIPVLPASTGMAYQKLANHASGYAIVGIAAIVTVKDGVVAQARIGITGAADHAYRADGVEAALTGQAANEETLKAAADRAVDGIELLDDLHAPADYRAQVTRNLTRRALQTALTRSTA